MVGAVRRFHSEREWRPHWVRAAHARPMDGATLETCPDAMLDILACDRLYRREFWDRQVGGFPEGVVYEDHVPMLRAYLHGIEEIMTARDVVIFLDPPESEFAMTCRRIIFRSRRSCCCSDQLPHMSAAASAKSRAISQNLSFDSVIKNTVHYVDFLADLSALWPVFSVFIPFLRKMCGDSPARAIPAPLAPSPPL